MTEYIDDEDLAQVLVPLVVEYEVSFTITTKDVDIAKMMAKDFAELAFTREFVVDSSNVKIEAYERPKHG